MVTEISNYLDRIEKLKGKAYGFCRSRGLNHQDSEDVVQDTNIIVIDKIGTLREPKKFEQWYMKCVTRRAIRYSQKESKRRNLPLNEKILGNTSFKIMPSLFVELHSQLESLPEELRQPINLKYFLGLSEEETSSRLGIPLGTVKSRTYRAKETLRDKLQKYIPAA